MADGRDESLWNHTASLLSMVHNVNCSDENAMRPPQAFNPYAAAVHAADAPVKVKRQMFVDRMWSMAGSKQADIKKLCPCSTPT